MEGIDMQRLARGFSEHIEPPIRHHLKNVYATLMMTALSACVGGFVHLYGTILSAGLLTALGSIATFIWLKSTPYSGKNQLQRLSLLILFGFLSGINIGPLLQLAIMVDEKVILQALLGTSVIFACFSLSAIFAPRGYFLYLGGILLSGLSLMFWLSMMNLFLGYRILFQANLYIGLVIMCGCIIFDTQAIMEKARMGDKDYISHSVDLFIDFFATFKRILIILTDKQAQDKRKRRN